VSISSTFFCAHFSQYPFAKKSLSWTFQLCNFWLKNIGAKCARKTLMKLTAGKKLSNKTKITSDCKEGFVEDFLEFKRLFEFFSRKNDFNKVLSVE